MKFDGQYYREVICHTAGDVFKCVPARQFACTLGMWDCSAPAAADTGVHLARSVATEQSWTRWTTESGVWCRSVFIRLLPETSVSWNSVLSTPDQVSLRMIVHGFTSPPTQYRLYGRRFLQVKRPNQQYQSTEGTHRLHNQQKSTISIHKHKTQQIP